MDADPEGEFEQKAEALAYRGQSLGLMGKRDEALADFEKSLGINPNNHECYFNRALVYLQEKDYELAEADLKMSIENYTPEDEEDKSPFSQGYLTLASAQERTW